MSIDIQFINHGSIWVAEGVSAEGKIWLEENLEEAAQRWGRDGFVIEHRYVDDIMQGAREFGLNING